MSKLLDFTALLLYCLFIYWLSDQPSLHTPKWFEHQDKLHHAGAYFIMAWLAWRCFRPLPGPSIIPALLSLGFCSLYGVTDEWHQSFVSGRTSDITDWAADTIGAGIAVILLYKLRKQDTVRLK